MNFTRSAFKCFDQMPTQEPKCSSQGWRTSEHRQRGKHWNQERKKINKQIEDPVEHGKCHKGGKVCFREVGTLTSVSRWWPGRGLVERKATLRLVSSWSSWWIQFTILTPSSPGRSEASVQKELSRARRVSLAQFGSTGSPHNSWMSIVTWISCQ